MSKKNNINLLSSNVKWLAFLAGAGALTYMTYKASQGVAAVADVISETGNAVNPVNPDNVFNHGLTTVISDATDGKYKGSGALGAWLYDKLH